MSASKGSRKCLDLKLLGECPEKENCAFSHKNPVSTVTSKVLVEIPKKIWIKSAMKRDFLRHLREIVECSLKQAGTNSVDIVVKSSNKHKLLNIEREYKILLSQLISLGPGWCYVHKHGLEECEEGARLKFELYEGCQPMRPGKPRQKQSLYALTKDITDSDPEAASRISDIIHPPRESETSEGLHRALDRAFTDKESFNPDKDVGVKIIDSHEDHMTKLLRWGLEWFCKEKKGKGPSISVCKLDGRFGKILWRNIPEDVHENHFGIRKFSDFCFVDTHHTRIFKTIATENIETANIKEFEFEYISSLESYDIKFTNIEKMDRFDVRITFDADNQPKILIAKKNEVKLLMFDFLYLHRHHDVRVTLNCYEVLSCESRKSPEYKVVEQLVNTLSLSDPDNGIISLQTNADDWSVYVIRHKKRKTYLMDNKYILTVTVVQERKLSHQPLNTVVELTRDLYSEPHTEIEFHNRGWECAFGHDAGLSPEKCLALYMETPADLPEITAHPWQPDDILNDFKDFLDNLDVLNEILDY